MDDNQARDPADSSANHGEIQADDHPSGQPRQTLPTYVMDPRTQRRAPDRPSRPAPVLERPADQSPEDMLLDYGHGTEVEGDIPG